MNVYVLVFVSVQKKKKRGTLARFLGPGAVIRGSAENPWGRKSEIRGKIRRISRIHERAYLDVYCLMAYVFTHVLIVYLTYIRHVLTYICRVLMYKRRSVRIRGSVDYPTDPIPMDPWSQKTHGSKPYEKHALSPSVRKY